MRKNKIYKGFVALFLLAMLFGSSAMISFIATEILFVIVMVMVLIIVILMLVRPYFKNKK